MSIDAILNSLNVSNNDIDQQSNSNQTTMDFEKYIISITTDSSYHAMPEFSDAFLAVDLSEEPERKSNSKSKANETITGPNKPPAFVLNEPFEQHPAGESDSDEETDNAEDSSGVDFFSNLYGFIFKDDEPTSSTSTKAPTVSPSTTTVHSTSTSTTTMAPTKTPTRNETPVMPPTQIQNNSIPLKLITILNNTKRDSPTKAEIKQRKNNKIIDPTDEPLLEDTQSPPSTMPTPIGASDKVENLTVLRDVLLATLSSNSAHDADHQQLSKSPIFLQRPITKISPTFVGNGNFAPVLSSVNSIDAKHSFHSNPIRSELDLIIPELNKNQQNDFNHKNLSPDGYQVLPHVNLDQLNEQRKQGETKIFTPPSKDPAGLLKLAGCNIYGRMYRVGRIIDELSGPCLECRCTEVGVSCTPLNC